MGAFASKPEEKTSLTVDAIANNNNYKIEEKVSEEVATNIKRLGNIIEIYNSNDSEALVNLVEKYQKDLATIGKPNVDVSAIKNKIVGFHQFIIQSLEAQGITNTNSRKKELLKDRNMHLKLKEMFLKKIESDKQAILQNRIIQKDPVIKNGLDSIFDKISMIRAKYKYFEHEFINMNLFLIIFLQHSDITMNNFVGNVIKITVERDKYRQKMMSELIALLLEIMTKSELEINPSDFDNIHKMMADLEKETLKTGESLATTLTKEAEMAKANLLDGLGSVYVSAAQASATSSQVDTTGINLEFPGEKKVGGFLRDNSLLPQSFYELSSLKE